MKNIHKFLLALATFSLIFLVLTPYFTEDFIDLQQKKENEETEKRLLKEEAARKITEKKNYLMGKFDQTQREDFVLVPAEYSLAPNKIYLRKETYAAYLEMRNAAKKNYIDLQLASATRNFDYQKDIWNKKWNGITLVDGKKLPESIPDGRERFEKILEYSAVPGTSRHHWGTDIDINNAVPEYFEEGKGKIEYEWLKENAPLFGFCQTYNEKGTDRFAGYNEEKWHWSYLPLARGFTEEYKNLISDQDIKGFLGDEYVASENIIKNYVLSINPDCL